METTKKDLEYYRKNAEEDYLTTPISVLRYITEMEQALRKTAVIDSFSMQDLMLYYQDAENFDFTSKAIEVLNSMVNDR